MASWVLNNPPCVIKSRIFGWASKSCCGNHLETWNNEKVINCLLVSLIHLKLSTLNFEWKKPYYYKTKFQYIFNLKQKYLSIFCKRATRTITFDGKPSICPVSHFQRTLCFNLAKTLRKIFLIFSGIVFPWTIEPKLKKMKPSLAPDTNVSKSYKKKPPRDHFHPENIL